MMCFLLFAGVLGKCRYVYYGKNSEGNRFIRDDQLWRQVLYALASDLRVKEKKGKQK